MNLDNKEILITGGTGSLGNALVTLLNKKYNLKGIRIFSRDELKQWQMAQKFTDLKIPISYLIGDVRDEDRLKLALKGVDCVIHTAALKHVPACENDPFEAIKTNILGTQNVISAALHNKVKKVMLVSTDKAVNPVNLYGSTKLCGEKILINANIYSPSKETVFSACRYGNIISSRGSVIPLFKDQAKKYGTLTITDARMTRFFTSLPFVANFILNRLQTMEGGEIFIPKMNSCLITDVAKMVAPKAELRYIGSRPGEKLHEILINEYEWQNTIETEEFYTITNKVQNNQLFEYSSDKQPFLLGIKEGTKLLKEYL